MKINLKAQRFIARIKLSPSNYTSVQRLLEQLGKWTVVGLNWWHNVKHAAHFKSYRRACFLKTSVVRKTTGINLALFEQLVWLVQKLEGNLPTWSEDLKQTVKARYKLFPKQQWNREYSVQKRLHLLNQRFIFLTLFDIKRSWSRPGLQTWRRTSWGRRWSVPTSHWKIYGQN